MEKKYCLSICIPTYNRETYVRRLLESIVTQKWFSEAISVVINDGPSTDNTEGMVREYQKHYTNIFYSRNEKAVGMLPAILESIDMSNGQYTWLFGSDDYMSEEALMTVMDIIREKSPTLVLSNRVMTDTSYSPLSSETQSIRYFYGFSDFSIYLWLPEKEKYDDKWNYLTFMSVFCFETWYYQEMKSYVMRYVCNYEALERHYFNYIVILFSALTATHIIAVVEHPRLVFCQWGNTSWKPNNKINIDIKMLMDFLSRTYVLSPNCKTLFRTFYRESFLYGSILYKVFQIPLLGKFLASLSRNRTLIKIYHRIIR